jgi:hypothetical protein
MVFMDLLHIILLFSEFSSFKIQGSKFRVQVSGLLFGGDVKSMTTPGNHRKEYHCKMNTGIVGK